MILGVKDLEQIEGTMEVLAHHIHNVDHGRGRQCPTSLCGAVAAPLMHTLQVPFSVQLTIRLLPLHNLALALASPHLVSLAIAGLWLVHPSSLPMSLPISLTTP